MKVVIVGAGEVGYNLATRFAREDYDITVIDNDTEKIKLVKTTVDAHVIEGDGASQRVLQSVKMAEVDIFLALTRIDEVNLVASRIAKKMGAHLVICRLRNTEYGHKAAVITPEQFGIDYVTYPEKAVQKEIEMLIRKSASADIQEFSMGLTNLVGIKLEDSSPLIGRTVQNVELSNPFIRHKLVVVDRKDHAFIPHQGTNYRKDDTVYILGAATDVQKIQQMAGKPAIDVKNVMILGAGKIGRLLAKSLQNDYDVRLIERDKAKAEKIGARLPNTLVLNDNGTVIEFLESERISEVDCYIAATDNEQTNILSSLLVKHMGVKQVITHITTTSYIPAVRRIGLDAV
ncbi:MAG: Trk system potassium transporter TrkA, partial [FCB group bacterium]|nr:Trk system potassium transporter TrkA [FCB group bacterium]